MWTSMCLLIIYVITWQGSFESNTRLCHIDHYLTIQTIIKREFFTFWIILVLLLLSMLLILFACDFVAVYPSHSQMRKNIYFAIGWYVELTILLPFATILNFVRSFNLLTVAMATEGSPIKVPCEKEDIPDKENAPDFDEDSLQGELGYVQLQLLLEQFPFH